MALNMNVKGAQASSRGAARRAGVNGPARRASVVVQASGVTVPPAWPRRAVAPDVKPRDGPKVRDLPWKQCVLQL